MTGGLAGDVHRLHNSDTKYKLFASSLAEVNMKGWEYNLG